MTGWRFEGFLQTPEARRRYTSVGLFSTKEYSDHFVTAKLTPRSDFAVCRVEGQAWGQLKTEEEEEEDNENSLS